MSGEYNTLEEWAEDNEFIPVHGGISFVDVDDHIWPREWLSEYVEFEFGLDLK